MGTNIIYTTVNRSAISFTGNTLGLLGTFNPSQSTTSLTADGIGTFITNDTLLTSPGGYPAGTTQIYPRCNSTAILDLLPASEVLFSALFWGGSYTSGNQNVTSRINDSVTLTCGIGSFSIFPISLITYTIPGGGLLNIYRQMADITSIVKANGSGSYTVAGCPGALGGTYSSSPNGIESNHLGWSIATAYKNQSLPYRNLTLWYSFEAITTRSVVVTITGFATPNNGPLNAKLAVSAGSGDTYIGGDSFQFGRTIATVTPLTGPNNTANNFFSSQINYGDSQSPLVGTLDKRGTFGNNNQPIGTKSLNGRQGFDVTNIDVSRTFTYNQTSANILMTTAGDYYYPYSLGLQIDVNAPNVTPIRKFVDRAFSDLNDVLTYTISFSNSGSTAAINTIFIDTITNGVTLVPNTFKINNSIVAGSPFAPGLSLNTIPVGTTVTISYSVTVNTIPSSNVITNYAGIGYCFNSAISLPTTYGFDYSNFVDTRINTTSLSIGKSNNKYYVGYGDVIDYSLTVNNNGTTIPSQVILIDTLPNGISFISNSLKYDGLTLTGNISTGVTLPKLTLNSISTITFKALVNSLPTPNPFYNTAYLKYSYTVDPTIPVTKAPSILSNSVASYLVFVDLSSIVKLVDKGYSFTGDTLTYTIIIPNNGNIPAYNCIFLDTLPLGTEFIENSLIINGISYPGVSPSPPNGVTLPQLNPNTTTTITFNVKVL